MTRSLKKLIICICLLLISSAAYAVGPLSTDDNEKDMQFYSKSDLYEALQRRLQDVEREIRDNEAEIVPITFPDNVIKQGYSHPNIILLRDRLADYLSEYEQFTGDEEAAKQKNYEIITWNDRTAGSQQKVDLFKSEQNRDIEEGNSPQFDINAQDIYDIELVNAVKEFQRQNGIKVDGIIGPNTLDMINRTLEDERRQILVNMHRLKQPEWAGRPDLRIEVDIARYILTAYENNEAVFEMPVIVGTKQRATNRFSTIMTGVRLNPGWTLPPTIKSEDYIPKLRENPEWVSDKGVMIYASWDENAQPIDPTSVDWNYLSDNEIKAMRFYKLAGNDNPLGRFRFLMNNRYDIYLHDTNQKYLFNRDERAFSSGCVRVHDPRKLVRFLLKDNPDWTPKKINNVLAAGETYNIRAARSIPVYFDYKTAWFNENGNLILGHDIYDLDSKIEYDNFKVTKKDEGFNKNLLED